MAFSEAHGQGFSPGTLVSSPASGGVAGGSTEVDLVVENSWS